MPLSDPAIAIDRCRGSSERGFNAVLVRVENATVRTSVDAERIWLDKDAGRRRTSIIGSRSISVLERPFLATVSLETQSSISSASS